MRKHAAPIIAAILLLLPVLYVGSYLVLIDPPKTEFGAVLRESTGRGIYRFGEPVAAKVFWPLEQLDRKVRPGTWEPWEPGDLTLPEFGPGDGWAFP